MKKCNCLIVAYLINSQCPVKTREPEDSTERVKSHPVKERRLEMSFISFADKKTEAASFPHILARRKSLIRVITSSARKLTVCSSLRSAPGIQEAFWAPASSAKTTSSV